MNIAEIHNPKMRARFERIVEMPPSELEKLGIPTTTRDFLVQRIVLPDENQRECCWRWTGSMSHDGRPTLSIKAAPVFAYRVLNSLLRGKHLRTGLRQINHEKCCPSCSRIGKCPSPSNAEKNDPPADRDPFENRWCMNPWHHIEGTGKSNAEYRSKCKKLHGGRNGSRTKPQSRPRGRNHPYSHFKENDAELVIQKIRATYDKIGPERGMIRMLARAFGKSPAAIMNVVFRKAYNEVPDDPSVALSISQLEDMVARSGYRPKQRAKWPRGDEHSGTRMSAAAKERFVDTFYSTRSARERSLIVDFVATRFGISRASVQNIAYACKTRKTAEPDTEGVSRDVLEKIFGQFLMDGGPEVPEPDSADKEGPCVSPKKVDAHFADSPVS